ncbi:hypothetical protein [Bacillus methanolicus]|uniref:hypothetical protein n=1 Tax=Bacillus methanolicus TaxID=1471 RepID=UPI0031597C41
MTRSENYCSLKLDNSKKGEYLMTIWRENEFIISTNKELLDIETIFCFLHNDSYWAKGIARETVEKSIENS